MRALQERAPDAPALTRYREAAVILTGDAAAEVADGVAWIQVLADELAVPGLADYGMTQVHFTPVLAQAILSSSMQGNPIGLTEAELTAVLSHAL